MDDPRLELALENLANSIEELGKAIARIVGENPQMDLSELTRRVGYVWSDFQDVKGSLASKN